MSQQDAWEQHATEEAQALAELLAADGRCVLVVVVGAVDDEVGTTHLLHTVAGNTRGAHLRQFIVGIERKLQWLRDKLHRRV